MCDYTLTCGYIHGHTDTRLAGYMLIMAYAVFVLCGFVGFLSCFTFIRKIYGSIKID